MKKTNRAADLLQIDTEREKELETSMADFLNELKKANSETAKDLERILCEKRNGVRLYRLRDCALLGCDRPVKIPASQFGFRKGKYPHYYDGFKIVPIDDFTVEGKRLLVLGKGAVSTQSGKLVVLKAHNRFSFSPSFHIVKPSEEDFFYVSIVLSGVDATRLIKGTRLAHTVEGVDLQMTLLPWPDKQVRQAFCSVWNVANLLHGGIYAQYLLEYWMLAVKNRDLLVKTPRPEVPLMSLPAHEIQKDHSEEVLSIVEGIINAFEVKEDSFLDVVASTPDLANTSVKLTADLCVCFPPPNQGEWSKKRVNDKDPRWVFGSPPRNKANYAWIQQAISCMAEGASAVMMLCNAPLHSEIGREKVLRQAFARSNLLDAVISLPGGLFADGRPPVSLIILQKGRKENASTLFIDAQDEGIDRGVDTRGFLVRSLSQKTIDGIIDTYMRWKKQSDFQEKTDFCRQVSSKDIESKHGDLMPYRYLT